MDAERRRTVRAGVAAQVAGVIWILQWGHALIAHGPGSHDAKAFWFGMTWMDSAKFLLIAYLLLVPTVRWIAARPGVAGRRGTVTLARTAVTALVVSAVATALEFRIHEWGTYTGTFDGATSPLWVSGVIRAYVSALVLPLAFVPLMVRAARARWLPGWLAPLVLVACLGTFFIGGPLLPLPGIVWLILGAALLARAVDASAAPATPREPAAGVA